MKKNIIIQLFLFLTLSVLFSCKKSTENPQGNIKVATRYSPTYKGGSGSCYYSYIKDGYVKVELHESSGTLVGTQNTTGNETIDFGTHNKGDYYIKLTGAESYANICSGGTGTQKTYNLRKDFNLNTSSLVVDIEF